MDIADALRRYCDMHGVKVLTDTVKELIVSDSEIKGVVSESEKEYLGASVIVATGGLSYSKTGSTGDGYRLAKKVGHTIVAPRASLVGLKISGGECKLMQGLSLKNTKLSLFSKTNNKCVYNEMGEMLFTHFGVSGPVALSASAYMSENPQNYYIELDLKPALSFEMLDARLCRDFSENINRDFVNSLGALLPKAMIDIVVSRSRIPAHKKVNQITRDEREALCRIIKAMRFEVCGREDIESAIITAGGVETREINPKTMESKLVKGLYFAGEVIDIDALTGGFNLQISFSTGYTAALNA